MSLVDFYRLNQKKNGNQSKNLFYITIYDYNSRLSL